MKRRITQEELKLIACAAMLVDHTGAVFFPGAVWMRLVGRLALPIYCFLLAEGLHHTKDPGRYVLRLLGGAVLAEIPFDLLFFGRLTLEHQSIMVTLLLGILYGLLQRQVEKLGHRIVLLIPFVLAAELLNCDYGGWGTAMVGMFILTREAEHCWISRGVWLAVLSWLIGGMTFRAGALEIPVQIFCVAALVPIRLYSGGKRSRNVWVQRAFYLFYPMHLAVILVIRNAMI